VNGVVHDPEDGLTVNVGLLSAEAVPPAARPPATTVAAAAVTAADLRIRFLAFMMRNSLQERAYSRRMVA
jgi:hypothetical protein